MSKNNNSLKYVKTLTEEEFNQLDAIFASFQEKVKYHKFIHSNEPLNNCYADLKINYQQLEVLSKFWLIYNQNHDLWDNLLEKELEKITNIKNK